MRYEGAHVDEDRTLQVAGAMLGRHGDLDVGSVHPTVVRAALPLHCLPADDTPQIASIVPAYACPIVDAVRDAFEEVPAWTGHLSENASLKARLGAMFGTVGLVAWASWCVGLPQSPIHPLSHIYF